MIKRIIFDLDNTLINVPNNLDSEFMKIINKFNLNITSKELYSAVGTYETSGKNIYYDKDKVINTVNSVLNINIDSVFFDEFLSMYSKLVDELEDGVVDTLKYLKNKYELVVLTNWFTESQSNRLKEAGILEYFDNVYGTDIVPMKPLKESFLAVMGDLKPDECVMVGDNLNVDIKIPYEMGMNVYHLNKKGTTKYPTIRRIKDLKERL